MMRVFTRYSRSLRGDVDRVNRRVFVERALTQHSKEPESPRDRRTGTPAQATTGSAGSQISAGLEKRTGIPYPSLEEAG
jgi:hypothetical protein